MNRITEAFLFLMITVCIVSAPPSAGAATNPESLASFRCGINYLHAGETQQQVFQQCGPPDARFSYSDYGRYGAIDPNVEKWTYNRGPEDFVYDFMFRNGQLEDIKPIGRGF